MEPFRPVADRFLFEVILNGTAADAVEKQEDSTFIITRTGRKMLVGLFNEKLASLVPYKGANRMLKNQILLEVDNLVKQIRQE